MNVKRLKPFVSRGFLRLFSTEILLLNIISILFVAKRRIWTFVLIFFHRYNVIGINTSGIIYE